jgi:hypothetical protein
MINDIEKLHKILIEEGLPQTDRGLYGLKCPYCGKSDRIRELEPPHVLESVLGSSALSVYEEIWHRFEMPASALGVCKFCQNPLRIPSTGTLAVPLTE